MIKKEIIESSDSEIELEDDEVFDPKDGLKEASDEEIELEEEEILDIKKERIPASLKATTHACSHCSFKATTLKGLQTHIDAKHKKIQYSCDFCDFKTSYKQYLKNHVNIQHNGVKGFSCSKCEFKTGYRRALHIHERKDHSEKNRKGGLGRKYTRKYPFQEVREGKEDPRRELEPGQSAHTPDSEGIVWCQFQSCDFSSKYCLNVTRHEQAEHLGIRYRCDKCEFTAKQRGTVLMHANSVHDGIVYHCEDCKFKTPWKSYLKRHLLDKHDMTPEGKQRGSPQPYSKRIGRSWKKHRCEECDRKYNSAKGFRLHMLRMHDTDTRYFYCEKCKFKTRKEEKLRHHTQRVHEGLKYSCSLCGFLSSYQKYVKTHSLKSHPEQKPQIKPVKKEDQPPEEKRAKRSVKFPKRSVKCPECEVTTTSINLIKKHMKTNHPVERKECKLGKCPDCDYSPSSISALKAHIKKRNRESGKTFPCNLCSHVNCLQRGLLRHKTISHGKVQKMTRKRLRIKLENTEQIPESSLNCSLCESKFKFQQDLFLHQKDSHGKTDFLSCEDCNFLHNSQDKLDLHRSKKLKCWWCKFETCAKYNLKHHLDKVHDQTLKSLLKKKKKCKPELGAVNNQTVKEEKIELPTERSCDKCDYKTSDSDDFYEHVLDHLPSNTSEPQKLSKNTEGGIEGFKANLRTILKPSGIIQSSTEKIVFNKEGRIKEEGDVVLPDNHSVLLDVPLVVPEDPPVLPEDPLLLPEDPPVLPEVPLVIPVPALLDHDYLSLPYSYSQEVSQAVGFLTSMEESEPGTEWASDTDNLQKTEIKCDFGCVEVVFSSEEDYFIHVTDHHNNF